jgi:hypothetical protein
MAQDAMSGTSAGTVASEFAGSRSRGDWVGPTGDRPDLTEVQILAWADAYFAASGHWPIEELGAVAGVPGESWRGVKQALARGERGLPGGSTLAELLSARRNVPLPLARGWLVGKFWTVEPEQSQVRGPRLRLAARGYRPRLTIDTILAWADAHYAATGQWPTLQSGAVRDSPHDETWRAIHSALYKGLRGLPGGSSLARLLSEHRAVRPRLTIERILAWADAHHAETGRWPTQVSGPVLGAYRENWGTIADDLRDGRRGLPGGITLARLLADQRQVRNLHTIGVLAIEQILAWADAHHAAHGRWPSYQSGPIVGTDGESWSAINSALCEGWRGLPGGSSLFRLLVEHREWKMPRRRPELTIEQVLAWADAHHAAHGRWPVEDSGVVAEAPEETWNGISQALARGGRGLPGGSSLARLLAEHRQVRNSKNLPRLDVAQVLAWADAHLAANGRWPSASSGGIPGARGEDWKNLDQALKKGHRGLAGGSSLARLLASHRCTWQPPLTMAQIQAWALAHHQVNGRWPDAFAGPVAAAPGEDWSAIDAALRRGRRGLPGGMSLRRLYGRSLNPDAVGVRPDLTLDQIRTWAEVHRATTGRWPLRVSGAIPGAPGEKWVNIDTALRLGRRGLPPRLSLTRLFRGESREESPDETLNLGSSLPAC